MQTVEHMVEHLLRLPNHFSTAREYSDDPVAACSAKCTQTCNPHQHLQNCGRDCDKYCANEVENIGRMRQLLRRGLDHTDKEKARCPSPSRHGPLRSVLFQPVPFRSSVLITCPIPLRVLPTRPTPLLGLVHPALLTSSHPHSPHPSLRFSGHTVASRKPSCGGTLRRHTRPTTTGI